MNRPIYVSWSTIDLNSVDLSADFTVVVSITPLVKETLTINGGQFESTISAAESLIVPRTIIRGLACVSYTIRAVQGVLVVEVVNWYSAPIETSSAPVLPDEAVNIEAPAVINDYTQYPYANPSYALGRVNDLLTPIISV